MTAEDLVLDLKSLSNPAKIDHAQRFFKTGKGQYGEGDKFWAVTVPTQRVVAKKYMALPLSELEMLVKHEIHEVRLTTFMLLVYKYQKAKTQKDKREIVDVYLQNIDGANNWDIVDTSAPHILGDYACQYNDKKLQQQLIEISKAKSIWLRRISIMFTFPFIRKGNYELTLSQAEKLLQDKEDLIHKAVGWMLREVGKKDLQTEYRFLDNHAKEMPRTMLRYAIERFGPQLRAKYLGV